MSKQSTFISDTHAAQLVAIFANEIRAFLQYLASSIKYSTLSRVDNNQTILSQVESAIVGKVKTYLAHPERFSDRQLVEHGMDFEKALEQPIRIEVRTLPEVAGCAQIAVRGICGDFRREALDRIAQTDLLQSGSFYLRVSGNASFEINQAGVDKSLPIRYLRQKWPQILKTIKYKPGTVIDSNRTCSVIAADGDGTTFSGPSLSQAPTIRTSQAYPAILEYLQRGGIYVIISGNHLQRTISRVKGLVPEELISRILITANGGANMVYFDHKGEVWELKDYREHALSTRDQGDSGHDLDIIYIGDDGRQTGNDREAFEAVGYDRSILVAKTITDDIIPALRERYVGGLEGGTRKVLEFVNQWTDQHPQQRIFTDQTCSEMIQKGLFQ